MSQNAFAKSNETLRKWENNGKYLQDSISDMLPLAIKCRDAWANRENADHYGNKIVKYLEAIDRITITMQECVLEFLEPSCNSRKQLEERIDLKNKHSGWPTKISELQKNILEQETKCQLLLKDKENHIQKEQELYNKIGELEAQKTQEPVIEEQEINEMKELKQRLVNWDKVQQQLRLQNDKFHIELQYVKQELRKVEDDNDNIKERLLQIPFLEEKLEQHQKLLGEIQPVKNENQEENKISPFQDIIVS